MKKLNYFWSIIIAVGFISCEKDELAVPKHNSGDVTTASANMNSDYKYQLYYNLETNTIVGQNLKTAWDLGFETSEDGYRIILNSSKAMFAFDTDQTNFESVTDTTGFMSGRKWDAASGNLDSTALGDWRGSNHIYILDRGYNESGTKLGFVKFQILSVEDHGYSVRYAQLDGTNEFMLDIEKDEDYNFTFLSMNSNSVVSIEPPKDKWDLVITQYIESLSTPYLVTGILLNRYNTSATMDSISAFTDITYGTAIACSLSTDINTIGYDWKKYDYDAGSFIIYPHMNYIINDQKGFYYKFHLIDFYDQAGNKGNPKWEYQKL